MVLHQLIPPVLIHLSQWSLTLFQRNICIFLIYEFICKTIWTFQITSICQHNIGHNHFSSHHWSFLIKSFSLSPKYSVYLFFVSPYHLLLTAIVSPFSNTNTSLWVFVPSSFEASFEVSLGTSCLVFFLFLSSCRYCSLSPGMPHTSGSPKSSDDI